MTASAETFQYWVSLRAWVEGIGLTLADVEACILRACSLREDGLRPEEIVAHFAATHDLTTEDAAPAGEIAAFLTFRGDLTRLRGGRYVARVPARPHVIAVVSVPADEWDTRISAELGRYVLRGRAEWGT